MNKLLPFLFISLLSWSAFASDFCGRRQPDIRGLLLDSSSRIAFKNGGGLLNKGVCWWHNRLQRSSAYLVKYNPAGNPPDRRQVRQILTSLVQMNKVVVIPGYSDFETFTRDHQREVQAILNDWQKLDGFFNFEWIRGISGRSSLDGRAMLLRMKNIYNQFRSSPVPLWIMAQIKGVTSHSFLVVKMTMRENGYDMDVIDSNDPQKTIRIEYNVGDTFLSPPGEKYSFVPYSGFQNDFRKISSALKEHCPQKNSDFDFNVKDGEVENYLQY